MKVKTGKQEKPCVFKYSIPSRDTLESAITPEDIMIMLGRNSTKASRHSGILCRCFEASGLRASTRQRK